MITQQVSDALQDVVAEARTWLLEIDEPAARHRPSPDRWSIAEVIGHLVDSACNNHQRFVRAQEVNELSFPKYEQQFWAQAGRYQHVPWHELVELWFLYNRCLAQLIVGIPHDRLQTPCTIYPYETCTLEFLVTDYLDHLNHHLNKIRERISLPANPSGSTTPAGITQASGDNTTASNQPYDIHTDVKYGPLERIDLRQIYEDQQPWFNQSLAVVNDCVIRVGVLHGEFHWHHHDDEDELFYVVEGCLLIDLRDRDPIELKPGQCFVVPRNVEHRTRAPERTVVLMFEGAGVIPTGD